MQFCNLLGLMLELLQDPKYPKLGEVLECSMLSEGRDSLN